VENLVRSARLLRQSGATLHLTLPLVNESARDVPSAAADTAFDDPKLSLRLGRFLDALRPVLLDVQSLSLGEAADVLRQAGASGLRRLFDSAVSFSKKLPRLLVEFDAADRKPLARIAAGSTASRRSSTPYGRRRAIYAARRTSGKLVVAAKAAEANRSRFRG
jgi:hypothetical protein